MRLCSLAPLREPFLHIVMKKNKDTSNRRSFVKSIALGSVGTALLGNAIPAAAITKNEIQKTSDSPKKKVLMKVGCQYGGTTIKNLELKARHGVYNIDGGSPAYIKGVGWDLQDSLAKKEACEKYGISLDAYHFPLTSDGIDKVLFPNIMLGKSPERDREIEMLQQMITVAGKTGVHCLNYNTIIFPVLRTGRTTDPERGNAEYTTWDLPTAIQKNEPLTVAGNVSLEQMYERITYLLDRLIPVAEEYKVRLANHIPDPPTPPGFRGITNWTGDNVFEGIKRFAQLYKSPYHGFNLCLGTTAEGLKTPRTDILPIIKWVGERKQIFNIHLRNIKGGKDHFMEVYPDNGDMDFFEVMKVLRDVEYPYMVMPDHVPHHTDPASSDQAFCFSYGYIKAMIQVLGSV